MISYSDDNSKIFRLLEEEDLLPGNFSADAVFCFEKESDLYLIIYSCISRNFYLFTAESFMQNSSVLPDLIAELQEQKDIPASLIHDAIRIVEERIHSKDNSRFYFDAH